MTDTVPAPRKQIEQALALVNDMTRFVGVMSLQDYVALDAVPRNLAAILAAPPTAEPVSDPHKLGWQPIDTAPDDGTLIDVWRDEGGRDTVFWGFPHHDCGEMGRYCDSDWHSIRSAGWVCNTFNELIGQHTPFTHWKPIDGGPNAQPLSNPQQLPEALKVEHEPVAWQVWLVNSEGEGHWSDISKYDRQKLEYFRSTGREMRPLFAHPAPASDELLEALERFARYYRLNDCHERLPDDALEVPISDLARAADLIAKHKGPQS